MWEYCICVCLISLWWCIYRHRWNLNFLMFIYYNRLPQSQTKLNYQISNISMNMPPRPSSHPASFTSNCFDSGHSDLTSLVSTHFKGDYIILYSYKHWMTAPVSPYPHRWVYTAFLVKAVLVDVKYYLLWFWFVFL